MLARATESIAWLASTPTARVASGATSFRIWPVPVPRSSTLRRRLLADGLGDRGLDRVLGRMQRAHQVPLRSELGEEGLRRGRALLANGGETLAIGARDGVVPIERGDDAAQELGFLRAFGEAIEHPGAFAIAQQEPRLDHHLEVPRDPRLGLPEDLGEVGDGELALAEKRKDAKPRLLARRAKHRQDRGEGQSSQGQISHVTLQK